MLSCYPHGLQRACIGEPLSFIGCATLYCMRSLLLVFATLAFLSGPSVVQANALAPSPTEAAAASMPSEVQSSEVQSSEVQSSEVQSSVAPRAADDRCQDHPLSCIIETFVGWLIGPIIAPAVDYVFTYAVSDVRVSSGVGEASDLGVRLGRTFHYQAAYGPLVFPYAAVGVRLQQNEPVVTPFPTAPTPFLETAVGLRTNLSTWHPAPPAWVERLHVTTEARWLHNGETSDHLWVEVAPGVNISQGSTAFRLHLFGAVAVAGDLRSTVRPGIGLEVQW